MPISRKKIEITKKRLNLFLVALHRGINRYCLVENSLQDNRVYFGQLLSNLFYSIKLERCDVISDPIRLREQFCILFGRADGRFDWQEQVLAEGEVLDRYMKVGDKLDSQSFFNEESEAKLNALLDRLDEFFLLPSSRKLIDVNAIDVNAFVSRLDQEGVAVGSSFLSGELVLPVGQYDANYFDDFQCWKDGIVQQQKQQQKIIADTKSKSELYSSGIILRHQEDESYH